MYSLSVQERITLYSCSIIVYLLLYQRGARNPLDGDAEFLGFMQSLFTPKGIDNNN